MARGRYTSSESAKHMKYVDDTRATKMEEEHDTTQAKKRAIHDDTQIWRETDPTFGGNPVLVRFNMDPTKQGLNPCSAAIYCPV